jgi:putative ABC transport system ATP-binding protein
MAVVEARGVSRVFPMPAAPVTALRDVSLAVGGGEYVAITGPSGCGKSTLLHLVGCVDTPTAGSILFEGQRFFLLPMLSAAENIELPQAEAGLAVSERRARTRALLEYVELTDRADHLPSQLSGGEMQRVAIARALANRPALLVADEPTGELDETSGERIADLFDRVHADGTAILVVTHNATLAARASRRLAMRHGSLVA